MNSGVNEIVRDVLSVGLSHSRLLRCLEGDRGSESAVALLREEGMRKARVKW